MSVCHTVVPELIRNKETNKDEICYQASSPDEGALVRGASSQGYVFYSLKPKEIVVKTVYFSEDFFLIFRKNKILNYNY